MSNHPLSARVHQLRYEADGIISIELRPTGTTASFPAVAAGGHIDVQLPNGIVRSYSFCNMPGETHRYVLGVLNDRNSRGGSRFIHEALRIGTVIGLSNPRNHFALEESAERTVLVAGGIGITPLLAMLQRLSALGRKVHMIYCARSRREAAFLEDVMRLTAATGALTLHFDDERGGAPDIKAMLASHLGKTTHFYACGPAPMLAAYEAALTELGQGNVHLERFSAPPVSAAVTDGDQSTGGEYAVDLRKSNRTITVKRGQTLLDALLEAGVKCDYSCCEGICGACETRVLAGDVDHHDSLLTDDQRKASKTMMICVSRAKGDKLVLDL